MELYFAPLACSMASRIAFYEAGLPVSFVQVDTHEKRIVDDGGFFLPINPLGQVPVLRLNDGELLTENAAILQYIGRLAPEAGLLGEPGELHRLQRWLGFVSSELHKATYTPLLGGKTTPAAKDAAKALAPARLDVLATHLQHREHLLQDFSVADAYLATVLNWSQAAGLDLGAWPVLLAYRKRIFARPSARRALDEEYALYREEEARRAA
jgi:glutathione S-transferase